MVKNQETVHTQEEETLPPKLLIVEDSVGTADIYRREVGGRFSVVVARSSAEARRTIEQDDQLTHIIVDGLHGGWQDLAAFILECNVSRGNRLKLIVISGASNISSQVSNYGGRYVSKSKRPEISSLIK